MRGWVAPAPAAAADTTVEEAVEEEVEGRTRASLLLDMAADAGIREFSMTMARGDTRDGDGCQPGRVDGATARTVTAAAAGDEATRAGSGDGEG